MLRLFVNRQLLSINRHNGCGQSDNKACNQELIARLKHYRLTVDLLCVCRPAPDELWCEVRVASSNFAFSVFRGDSIMPLVQPGKRR